MQSDAPQRQNSYVVGYGRELRPEMSQRTIAADAGFLLPHLRPGMRVLDCGSGPGTIALDLAEDVTPADR